MLARAAASRSCPTLPGCFTAAEAVLTAKLAREAFETDWVKLEVIGDDRTLLPDPLELLDAAEQLVEDGFVVLAYTNDDPVLARRLEQAGLRRRHAARLTHRQRARHPQPPQHRPDPRGGQVPVVLDAGIGTASDAARPWSSGATPCWWPRPSTGPRTRPPWPRPCALAVEAGRSARRAGRIPRRFHAEASSPFVGPGRSRGPRATRRA